MTSNPTTTFGEDTTAEEVVAALKDQIRGKNILLVGATVGSMGPEFLRVVAPFAKTIWVAGRNKERASLAVDHALKEIPNGGTKATIHVVEMDLLDFDSVRSACGKINDWGEPLDLIVQNAQIAWAAPTATKPDYTPSGLETQWTGNHLSTVLLTSLLLPRLRQSGRGARVVVVSSEAYEDAVPRWDDVNWVKRPEEYARNLPYRLSKLANVLFVKELAKRLAPEGILAYSVHPGVIMTQGLLANAKALMLKFGVILEDGSVNPTSPMKVKTLSQGVATYCVAAFDPSIEGSSGAMLENCHVIPEEKMAANVTEENVAEVWKMTEETLNISIV